MRHRCQCRSGLIPRLPLFLPFTISTCGSLEYVYGTRDQAIWYDHWGDYRFPHSRDVLEIA